MTELRRKWSFFFKFFAIFFLNSILPFSLEFLAYIFFSQLKSVAAVFWVEHSMTSPKEYSEVIYTYTILYDSSVSQFVNTKRRPLPCWISNAGIMIPVKIGQQQQQAFLFFKLPVSAFLFFKLPVSVLPKLLPSRFAIRQ